jgi:hypothetical protein
MFGGFGDIAATQGQPLRTSGLHLLGYACASILLSFLRLHGQHKMAAFFLKC